MAYKSSRKSRIVRSVCRRFGKSTVAYYNERKRKSQRLVDDKVVVRLVNEIRMELPFLGGRKLYFLAKDNLRQKNIKIGRDKFFDILRCNGLLIERRKAFIPKTTKCDASLPISSNLTKNLVVNAPNQVHVSDITYIKIGDAFAYLSLVTDRFTREIIGWCLSKSLKAEGPIAALKMAMRIVPKGMDVIEHSDRGCQYASRRYRRLLQRLGLRSSMTEEKHCYENGAAERVNGILKCEFALDRRFKTFEEAKKAVKESINAYNTKRPHEMLGYMTPSQARENPKQALPMVLHNFELAQKASERSAEKRKKAEQAGRKAA